MSHDLKLCQIISSNFPVDQGETNTKYLTHSERKHNHNTVDTCARKINEKRKLDTDRDEDQDEQWEEKHVAKKPKVCTRISHLASITIESNLLYSLNCCRQYILQ